MKLKYIDVLRGLAIIGVLIVHCAQYGNNKFSPPFTKAGALGVQLFYIASAFTLFLSMDRRFLGEKYPIKNFFIRRFFRIAPMYYMGIAYYLWQDGFGRRYWLGDANFITIGNIFSNILFVHGFNPYWINSLVPGGWSIAVEMLFYCLVPLLFLKINNTKQAFIFLNISLIVSIVLFYFLRNIHTRIPDRLWSSYLFFYLPSQLPIFALGILFYFIIKENYQFPISPYLITLTSIFIIGQSIRTPILPIHFLVGIAFVTSGIVLSKYKFKVLINPLFIYLGKISFSMYLIHPAVLHWLSKFNFADYIATTNRITGAFNYSLRFLIVIVITSIISTFSYILIEMPMQNVGKQLIKNLNK